MGHLLGTKLLKSFLKKQNSNSDQHDLKPSSSSILSTLWNSLAFSLFCVHASCLLLTAFCCCTSSSCSYSLHRSSAVDQSLEILDLVTRCKLMIASTFGFFDASLKPLVSFVLLCRSLRPPLNNKKKQLNADKYQKLFFH